MRRLQYLTLQLENDLRDLINGYVVLVSFYLTCPLNPQNFPDDPYLLKLISIYNLSIQLKSLKQKYHA